MWTWFASITKQPRFWPYTLVTAVITIILLDLTEDWSLWYRAPFILLMAFFLSVLVDILVEEIIDIASHRR